VSAVLDAVAVHAARTPDTIALSGDDQSFSYRQLMSAVEATAAGLCRIAPDFDGAPVAVIIDNGPAWVILDLALIRLGWPSVPIPAFFTAAQRAHVLTDAGAGMLITESHGPLEICGTGFEVALLSGDRSRFPPSTAKITYTSGSTGQAKGVCLSLAQMEAVAVSIVETIGADYAGVHMPVLPLAILLENVAGLYVTLIAGGRYHVLTPGQLGLSNPFRPDMARLVQVLDAGGATSLILVPELLRALLLVLGFTGARLPALRFVAVGGAKVAVQLLEQAEVLGLPVFEGYGLSECASVVALNTPAQARKGSVGRPLPHVSLHVDAGGEVVIGGQPFLGYTGGPPQTWPLHTGDLGRVDADGFLTIEGRRSNVIINAFGRNIAPEWVESELLAQPEILQAVVFGEAQAALSAVIVPLMPGMTAQDMSVALGRANANLPAYAQVQRICVRGPFDPAAGELTGNGRPRRAVLMARHRDFLENLEGSRHVIL
jgi:long-subunit acyl-CoA synthetase (AMP-forming)